MSAGRTAVWTLVLCAAWAPTTASAQVDTPPTPASFGARTPVAPDTAPAPPTAVDDAAGLAVPLPGWASPHVDSSHVTRPHRPPGRGWIIPGSLILAVFYGIPVAITIANGLAQPPGIEFEPEWFLPIAGPFMLRGQCDTGLRGLCEAGLVWVGLSQLAGAALLATGIVVAARASDVAVPRAATVRLVPLLAPGHQGLAFRATF